MTTLDTTAATRHRSWRGSSVRVQLAVLTGRSLRAMAAEPRLMVLGMLQPLLMLLVLSEVFGSMANPALFPPGVAYIDYLMPAILLNTGLGAAQVAGMGLIKDMDNGVLARFRSLPITMFSVLFARSVADLARTSAQLVILLLFGAGLFGYSPAGGVLGSAGAWAIMVLITWSITWVFLALASWLRSTEAMQSIGLVVMFPLLFASSAFVPVASLPSWLQIVAAVNPLTYGVDACRKLALATPGAGGAVVTTLLACTALGGVAACVAAKGFSRAPEN